MEIIKEKINFQTTEEAEAVKSAHRQELEGLALKYKMSVEELVSAANDDRIDDQKDLFLIFKRSYLLSEQ
jgi:hypothetical protein